MRGDARNDLRLATGAMPGNWMQETGTLPIPYLLTTGFADEMVVAFLDGRTMSTSPPYW
jgi:hypothetical protein